MLPAGVSFDLETARFWVACEAHGRDMPALYEVGRGWSCLACRRRAQAWFGRGGSYARQAWETGEARLFEIGMGDGWGP